MLYRLTVSAAVRVHGEAKVYAADIAELRELLHKANIHRTLISSFAPNGSGDDDFEFENMYGFFVSGVCENVEGSYRSDMAITVPDDLEIAKGTFVPTEDLHSLLKAMPAEMKSGEIQKIVRRLESSLERMPEPIGPSLEL